MGVGKNEEMNTRNTKLEPTEPDLEKPESEDSMAKRPNKPAVRLGREAQARIGEQLRSMYNAYINQGVPSHLAELVRKISDQE
jgi:hypothetical protein